MARSKHQRKNRAARRAPARPMVGPAAATDSDAPPHGPGPAPTGRGVGGRPRADYDATVSKKYRRQAPRTENFLEDRHLRGNARQTLVATGRDQLRNFPLAGWALRRHLDYCTGHILQIHTGDDEYNDALEARFRAWAENPDVYDVARRHGHTDAMRLVEAAAFTAGDHFIVLRADGRVQHIESDRVRDPMDIPAGWIVVDGVHLDTDGRPLHYAVHSRGPDGTDYLFEDWIDARHVIHYGYFQRFDQVRGIAQTAATQNTGQDLHEAHEGMLLNLKLRNAFLMTVNREPVEGPKRPAMFGGAGGDGDAGTSDEDAAYENARRKINPLKGPAKMEMRPGESVTFHEAKTPSMEAQQYTERLTHFFLLGHDIPRSFYDVGGTSYSGARQELIQYYQAIRWIRDRLKRVGDRIFAWWLAREIAAGRVTLPDGYTVETLPRDWIAPGLPWIDPLKEIAAHAKALEMGITTRSRIARELYGLDYAELVRERAREDRMMKKYGVAPALEKSDATEPSDGARGPGKAPAARRTWRHRVAGWFGRAPVSAVPSVSPVGKAVA